MKHCHNRSYIKSIITVVLLVTLLGAATGCADFGQFPTPTLSPAKPETVPPSTISTEDRAILAVYEHLLSLAGSYQAKKYLAEFYATCDNWSAKSELLKDGTSLWYVVVDMTGNKAWRWQPYWQQAGWFILRDGRVIPSNRLQSNALRIEADLQELSLPPKPQAG